MSPDAPRTGDSKKSQGAYPVRTVARLTGLTPDIIRAWEKRYEVVAPQRGPRGARLYSNADVGRLRLLAQVVAGGHSIGDVARLTEGELQLCLAAARRGPTLDVGLPPADQRASLTTAVLVAAHSFDTNEIERLFGEALIAVGTRRFCHEILVPLLQAVGEGWQRGEVTVAEEHLISAVVRRMLLGLMHARQRGPAPSVVLATAAGDDHELGLMLAGLDLLHAGLNVAYLGADLPAQELAAAAQRAGAVAVGVSVVDPNNRPKAITQITELEAHLDPAIRLWIGGRDAVETIQGLRSTRATVLVGPDDIERAAAALTSSRNGQNAPERN